MKLNITHKTTYTYDAPVLYGLQQVRLTPANSRHQTVHAWDVDVTGGAIELSFQDQYQNQTLLVQAHDGAEQVELIVSGQVETHTSDGVFGKVYGPAPLWHYRQSTPHTAAGTGIAALAQDAAQADTALASLHRLSDAILTAVPYKKDATTVDTKAEESLQAAGGVCQDHAQIFISAARALDIPARYVSGYLRMDDQIDQDASHAWAEAHVDGLGWVAFDVSNSICPDERYIRLAIGRDAKDAAPVTGMRLGDTAETMQVSLQVQQ